MLHLYTDYLIGKNLHKTATGLSEPADNNIKHDKVTRFLRAENFHQKILEL